MAEPVSTYRRLTGKSRHLTGHSQLWLGSDHILLVTSNRFVEHYQRFAFADIAAIVVTESPEATVGRIVGAGAAILWTLLALAVGSRWAGWGWFFLITGLLGIAAVVIDMGRGRRCRCYLYTAVSCERLKPVSRESTALAFLAAVTPEVEAVQGTLSPQRIAERIESQAGSTDNPMPPPVVAPDRSAVQTLLFALFLLNAAYLLVVTRWPSLEVPGLIGSGYFGEAALLIFLLIRDAGGLRRLSYGVMVIALVCYLIDLVNVGIDAAGWFMQVARSGQEGATPPGVLWTRSARQVVFAEGWRSIAGLAGFLASYYERHTTKDGPVLNAPTGS